MVKKKCQQLILRKIYLSRYKSKIWSSIQKKYNSTKQKCCYILKAFKKVSYHLYRIRFVLKKYANNLVAELNWSYIDIVKMLICNNIIHTTQLMGICSFRQYSFAVFIQYIIISITQFQNIDCRLTGFQRFNIIQNYLGIAILLWNIYV